MDRFASTMNIELSAYSMRRMAGAHLAALSQWCALDCDTTYLLTLPIYLDTDM